MQVQADAAEPQALQGKASKGNVSQEVETSREGDSESVGHGCADWGGWMWK
jgi:hypothetical protein